MNKYQEALQGYNLKLNDSEIKSKVEQIIDQKAAENFNKQVYKKIFNCIDLTSLNPTDHQDQIIKFTEKVNQFEEEYGDLHNVAAICVFPNHVATVRATLEITGVRIAAVSAGFPTSQTFTEVKNIETGLAVLDGADDIDIVINIGNFLAGNYQDLCDEIIEIKEACKEAHLKVILETGLLKSAENIKKAAILAIYSGADFIKTSTGKIEPAATLEAAYIMCQTIKEYYDKTNIKIGFKPAGGIVTTKEAVHYYTIVKEVLGEEWLNNQLFRIGASRLANNLLSDITDQKIKFF